MPRYAVVTGASSGLGLAVTQELAEVGYTVFALARTVKDQEYLDEVVPITCNIRDLDDIDMAFKEVDAMTDTIDCLINCAGRGLMEKFEDISRQDIMDTFGVNLKGNIYIAQEVYRRMLPKKAGHIINVSSTTGLKARAMETIYAASKWGLRGFTESLRLEAIEHGIRVTGVYPGGMQSEKFWSIVPDMKIDHFMPPADVAHEIVKLLDIPHSIAPSEIVLERGA